MKKIIKQSLLLISTVAVMAFGALSPVAMATNIEGLKTATQNATSAGLEEKSGLKPASLVTEGLKYLMYAIGVISVVMIIIGGIRYATSGGSADKVKSAKNTILYACVGLAVALLALAIVTFVQSTVTGIK